jgi:predicted amidophosphoribosyltransferase
MDKRTRDYIKKVKRGRENVKCYAYVYHLMKDAGICTACKMHYQDIRNICMRCYEQQRAYRREYYKHVEKPIAKLKKL